MDLSPIQRQFILRWSEIGIRWGINRTTARVHALLNVCPQPISAEEIAKTLSVSRSNVSTCLRELKTWGLIRTRQDMGDRQERFDSVRDIWSLGWLILDERKRREFDPAVVVLRRCLDEPPRHGEGDVYARRRLQEMLQLFEMMDAWYDQVRRLPRGTVVKLVKMGLKIQKLLLG